MVVVALVVTAVLVVRPAGNSPVTRIERFGYRGDAREGVARVVSTHGDYYHLVCNETEGEILARKKKSAFMLKRKSNAHDLSKKEDIPDVEILQPITGDFVTFRYNAQGDSMILEVLPRWSHFERKDPTARRQSQTLAVNFDYLFIMMSLNENYSEARLARFLELAEDMGEAKPIVVLTKSDLLTTNDELRITNDGCIFLSNVTGEGLDKIREIAQPGVTIAMVGSSGVGKSSLVNSLAGEEWCATQEIQEWSGKGRHTTTSRELIMLPNGAMIVDTPGIREIGIVGEADLSLMKGASTHRYRIK